MGDEAVGRGRARDEDVCVAISGAGGLIGLFISDRARLNETLARFDREGYRMTTFTRAVGTNLPYRILQSVCFMATLGIWCPAPAGLLFFHREVAGGDR